MQENIILQKTIAFSLQTIEYVEILEQNRKYVIARQLLKSATSIGANMHEAQQAESKIDFIHKCKIASKEIEETKYWLTLCKEASHYPICDHLIDALLSIEKIINKIIASAKRNVLIRKLIIK